jgi:hypothetical protein
MKEQLLKAEFIQSFVGQLTLKENVVCLEASINLNDCSLAFD